MAAFEPEPAELVANLDTPSILCDLDRLERNIAEWQAIMDRNQVRFRPHIKTHKIPEIARIQIDVDSGLHRGGVPMAEIAEIEQLARAIGALPGVEFDGLTTHRGIWHEGSPRPEDAGHDEGRLLVDIAEKLRAAGIEVREVTAGGSKTFSGDGGVIGGSGARDIARATDRRVFVERLTEEHGMARAEEPVELGEKLRFYPFHACTCANLTNQIIGFRGDRVETVWTVAARGLRT